MGDLVGFPGGNYRRLVRPERTARLAEQAEVADMRTSLLTVGSRHQAMRRIQTLAERVAAILDEIAIDPIDRASLVWHLSAIRELADAPVCALPRRKGDSATGDGPAIACEFAGQPKRQSDRRLPSVPIHREPARDDGQDDG